MRRAWAAGFTLIEITVVMLVVALLVTLVVPQFRARTHADLKRSALRLAATIEHTFYQSAFRRETLRLHFDLDGSSYWLDRFVDPGIAAILAQSVGDSLGDLDEEPDAEENTSDEPYYLVDRKILAEPVQLPDGVFITSVTTQYLDEISSGEAFTHFFPDGYVEPTVIYLADEGKEVYTLYVPPLSGKVKVLPGYHEFEVDMREKGA